MVRLYYMEFPRKNQHGTAGYFLPPFFRSHIYFFRESFIMKVSHSRVIFLKGGPSQMKINTVWAAYFSATDTTKTVVTQIAKELARHTGSTPGDLRLHPAPDPQDPPRPSARGPGGLRHPGVRLPGAQPADQVRGLGPGQRCLAVPVVCYGNRHYDDALMELRNTLRDGGSIPWPGRPSPASTPSPRARTPTSGHQRPDHRRRLRLRRVPEGRGHRRPRRHCPRGRARQRPRGPLLHPRTATATPSTSSRSSPRPPMPAPSAACAPSNVPWGLSMRRMPTRSPASA